MEQTEESRVAEMKANEDRLRSEGWDGKECKLCFTRRKSTEAGTWTIGFRWCPYCAAEWR